MNKKQANKKFEEKPRIVWLLLLSVTSITLYFQTNIADPFNSTKLVLLLLTSGWLSGHLINSYRLQKVYLYSQDLILVMIVTLFLTALLISTLLTDIPVVGFIGDTQRRNGFLSYFGLSIILLCAARSFNTESIIRLFKVGIFTGLILSIYGLMQLTGNDFVKWNNPYNSMISTLGNPNFASAILAVLTLLSLLSIVIFKFSLFLRIMTLTSVVLSIFCIIRSDSRQGLLVIFFGLLFYIAVTYMLQRRILGLFIAFMAGTIGLLAVSGMLQRGPLTSILYKDSISVRGYYWRAGIEMFKNNILTGVGVDRYGAYFKSFRELTYSLKYGFDITSSNAHNVFIQLFSTAGIFVGVIYCSLIFYIFLSGINLIRSTRDKQRQVSVAMLSIWIGFQSQTVISIDNIGVAVWGWMLGGAIVGLSHNSNQGITSSNTYPINKSKVIKINLFQPLISSIVLMPLLVISFYIHKYEKEVFLLRNYTNSQNIQEKDISFQLAKSIYQNPLGDPNYKIEAAGSLYAWGYTSDAYKMVRELYESDPKYLDFLKPLVFLEEANGNLDEVIILRQQILKNDPWNFQNIFELAKALNSKGDIDASRALLNKIIQLAPNTDLSSKANDLLRIN